MVSLTLVADNRIAVGDAGAEVARARVSAAADAGLALALDGLLVGDRAMRWSIDGRIHETNFGGTHIRIRIEDERGKVPLNLLDEDTAKALVEATGKTGIEAQIAADSLLDWTDDDDDPRPNGAESAYYAKFSIHPSNGPPRSLDELTLVRGWDRSMIEQIRPFVTIWFGRGGFDARFAQPKAIGIMLGGGDGNPLEIQRQRESDGQRTAIELGDDIVLVGRPLSVVVEATDPTGARAVHRTIIELTGARDRPYVVRGFE